jgi:hypothetical protein
VAARRASEAGLRKTEVERIKQVRNERRGRVHGRLIALVLSPPTRMFSPFLLT